MIWNVGVWFVVGWLCDVFVDWLNGRVGGRVVVS